jgi:pimeloyl-ACP methyl ester carboxylesterase
MVKSFYMLLFAHEGVGEAFLRRDDHEALRTWLGHPRAEAVIEELERDGQMSSHLQWYRANIPPEAFVAKARALPLVQVPTLGIWSSGDPVLGEAQMKNSEAYCTNEFSYVRLDDVGHWIPLDAAPRLVDELVNFLPSTARAN